MRGHQIRGETDRIPDELVAMFERKKKTLDSYKEFGLSIWPCLWPAPKGPLALRDGHVCLKGRRGDRQEPKCSD